MTRAELEDVLSRVSFRDWSFRILGNGEEFFGLKLLFLHGEEARSTRTWSITPEMSVAEVVRQALQAVLFGVEEQERAEETPEQGAQERAYLAEFNSWKGAHR